MNNYQSFLQYEKKLNIPLRNLQPDTVPFSDGDGLKHWRSFRNAINTIRLLQNPKTKRLNSPDELTISGYRPDVLTKPRSDSSRNFNDALKIFKCNKLPTQYNRGNIKQGSEKYFYDQKSQHSLVNKNQKGITPLYAAAKLGHLEICKILIEKELTHKYRQLSMGLKKPHWKLPKDGGIQKLFTFYNNKIDIISFQQHQLQFFSTISKTQMVKVIKIHPINGSFCNTN